jgi:hypothetical protein
MAETWVRVAAKGDIPAALAITKLSADIGARVPVVQRDTAFAGSDRS